MRILAIFIFLSFTNPSFSSEEKYLGGERITFDAHFHYRESNDGLFGTPGECELDETDKKVFRLECSKKLSLVKPNYSEEDLNKCVEDKINDYSTNLSKYCEPEFSYIDLLESSQYNNVEKVNIISNSCMISHSREANEWENLKKNIEGIHDHVSGIHQKHPNRVIGSCGVELTWPLDYLDKELSRCLSLPGMKGIKIHVPHDNHKFHILNINVLKKIHRIFSIADKKRGFILWHLDIHKGESTQNEAFNFSSLNLVMKTLDTYPNVKLIIPHALHSMDGFKIINDIEEKSGKRKNLFIDLTDVERNFYETEFTIINNDGVEEVVTKDVPKKYYYNFQRELQRFGTDRILFATDNFYYREGINQLKEFIGLSQKEQIKIRVENGLKFLEGIQE